MWIIQDWAGNVCFGGAEFDSFDDAEEFISNQLEHDYDEFRGEFYIVNMEEECELIKFMRDRGYIKHKNQEHKNKV